MPALFIFLLKVNIALIICCLGYYQVLRQLTFYTLNRVYLVIAIIFSSVYPLIDINDFVQRHRQIAIPVQTVVINWKAPANQLIQQPQYWYWATLLFWIGAIVFASRLVMQLISLYKIYKNSSPDKIQDHQVRIVKADISPFSFWQSIYINPANLNPNDLESILQHEQVHVKQWHTIDILLSEISVVFYWFNPGVWLMKKAVRENIEFITDRKILQKGIDSKSYQYSLLNVSFNVTKSAAITNHFNFSTLKKRIIMMNAKRSANVNLTRYAFLVPAVLICLFTISLSKAQLVKKSKMAYKTISANVKKLVVVADVAVEKPVAQKPADTVRKATPDIKETAAVTYSATADTDRIAKRSLKTDSAAIYINGIRSTNEDLSKLNPDNIATFNVYKQNGGTILVTTKNNGTSNETTTGNATITNGNTLNKVYITGYSINGKTVALKTPPANSVPVNTIPVSGKIVSGFIPSKVNENKPLKEVTVIGHKIEATGSNINIPVSKTIPAAAITQFHIANGNPSVTDQPASKLNGNKPLKEVTVIGYKADNVMVTNVPVEKVIVDGVTVFRKPDQPTDNVSITNHSTLSETKPLRSVTIVPSRNHTDFTGKLILINGKEATEEMMKELSIARITSTTPYNGDDASPFGGSYNKVFGDKAKNGVVWITVKKSDK